MPNIKNMKTWILFLKNLGFLQPALGSTRRYNTMQTRLVRSTLVIISFTIDYKSASPEKLCPCQWNRCTVWTEGVLNVQSQYAQNRRTQWWPFVLRQSTTPSITQGFQAIWKATDAAGCASVTLRRPIVVTWAYLWCRGEEVSTLNLHSFVSSFTPWFTLH